MLRRSVLLRSLVLLLVGACATGNDVADKGRRFILGMDVETLQSCAGILTRTRRLDPQTELYSYEIKYERTGGAELTLPIIGGGFKIGGSGSYFPPLVRLIRGQVAAGAYNRRHDRMILPANRLW